MAADTLTVYSLTPPQYADTAAAVNTVLVDSIAADTVEGRIPHFATAAEIEQLREEAALDSIKTAIAEQPSGRRDGIAGEVAGVHYSHSTPLLILLFGILAFAAVNSASVVRALSSYRHELWSVKRRRNVFDDERSAPIPAAVLLMLIYTVFGGIAAYNLPVVPAAPTFSGACTSMSITGLFFLFHYAAYNVVGYTFGKAGQRRRWVDGYLAATAYCGILLILPAILMVFHPEWHDALLDVSISIVLIMKMLFIVKGFRIFFDGIGSLLYFILYLCTLEIIPAIAFYRVCVYFQGLSL